MCDAETDRLVACWTEGLSRVEQLRQDLRVAEQWLDEATRQLARWVTPDDAQEGETFHIWHHGQLLQVTKHTHLHFVITWRRVYTEAHPQDTRVVEGT